MTNRIQIQYYKTAIGELILGCFDDRLCLLDFRYRKMRTRVDHRIRKGLNAEFSIANHQLLDTTRRQICEYLRHQRATFDIPLIMVGTDFQKSVWRALQKVPYGTTSSYARLAKAVGRENAVRAVAGANGANALSLIIPCHRIIGSDGSLAGYGGGVPIKKRLLKLEQTGPFAKPPNESQTQAQQQLSLPIDDRN